MDGCNATLTVYVESPHDPAIQWRERLVCVRSNTRHENHVIEDGSIVWDDNAPGATPHPDAEDGAERYRRLLEAVAHVGEVQCHGPSTDSCLRCQIERTLGRKSRHTYPNGMTSDPLGLP